VVRAGGEQARAAIEVEKHRLQLEASRKPGQIFEHESKGSPRGKQNEVEEDAQVIIYLVHIYIHTHTHHFRFSFVLTFRLCIGISLFTY
jgi:hypothetical protein